MGRSQMIQLTPQMRIFASKDPVDFRCGIDGLSRICREKLKADPFSGYVFIFRNRIFKSIKILVYDGQGFWLLQKRLSKGSYKWWPSGETESIKVDILKLQLLLWNAKPESAKYSPMWKEIEK
jgi:transposase